MNTPSDSTIEVNRQIGAFIADIAPIFRGRDVFIADVGAHWGATFAAFFQSDLKVNRACLFEANPRNFEKLKHNVSALGAEDRATCLNIALSDRTDKLYLHDMNDMSRVVGSDIETGDGQVFEVDAKPLDDFQSMFPDGHISILKIDVEGHEAEVIGGAKDILAGHAAEFIYVEAGLDRDNAQQTHYRAIEDMLLEHGYRLFRIYEQTMEWVDDRPLLRRMNMAFISPVAASKYPYSMLKELARQDAELARLRKQCADQGAEIEQAREKLRTAHEELATLARAVSELEDDRPQSDVTARLAIAEKRARDIEASTSWRLTAPIRKILDTLKR